MKVLFSCNIPFWLAHGGMQVQIEQSKSALEAIGVEVEPLRWWDPTQHGDILHHFAALSPFQIRLAQEKGIKVVQTAFLGGLGAKPAWQRFLQKVGRRVISKVSPQGIRDALGWDCFRLGDACIAMTEWEAYLLRTTYQVEKSRLCVIPNGVEDVFFNSAPSKRGQWLICTATIVELKQVLKLAQSAVAAGTPLWVIGRPFSTSDPYVSRFQQFASENSKLIRFEGPILDRKQLAAIYREARGFVLLSRWESLSLSALEASACELPLLLSDLPWARTAFGNAVSYCPVNASIETTAKILKSFYEGAPVLPPPRKPLGWGDVAAELRRLYEGLLKRR